MHLIRLEEMENEVVKILEYKILVPLPNLEKLALGQWLSCRDQNCR